MLGLLAVCAWGGCVRVNQGLGGAFDGTLLVYRAVGSDPGGRAIFPYLCPSPWLWGLLCR